MIGKQQQFLVAQEPAMRRANAALRRGRECSAIGPPEKSRTLEALPAPLPKDSKPVDIENFMSAAFAHVDVRVQELKDRIRAMQASGIIPPPSLLQGPAEARQRRWSTPEQRLALAVRLTQGCAFPEAKSHSLIPSLPSTRCVPTLPGEQALERD